MIQTMEWPHDTNALHPHVMIMHVEWAGGGVGQGGYSQTGCSSSSEHEEEVLPLSRTATAPASPMVLSDPPVLPRFPRPLSNKWKIHLVILYTHMQEKHMRGSMTDSFFWEGVGWEHNKSELDQQGSIILEWINQHWTYRPSGLWESQMSKFSPSKPPEGKQVSWGHCFLQIFPTLMQAFIIFCFNFPTLRAHDTPIRGTRS